MTTFHYQALCDRVTLALRRAAPPQWLPLTVRCVLTDPALTARLLGLVRRLSGYQNLTKAERRERAIALSEAALAEEGRTMREHDLSILVALLYARVKEETPFLIAAEPKRW